MIERDFIDNAFQPTLDDFKHHLRITGDAQDSLLMMYLKAAISSAEHYIGRVIAISRFKVVTSSASIELSKPLVGVNSVEVGGKPLTKADYSIKENLVEIPCVKEGEEVKVVYTAGMNQVPFDIKASILLTAADLFTNPVDGVRNLPTAASRLLDPYRNYER